MATRVLQVLANWRGIEWDKPENAERNRNAARLLEVLNWDGLIQLGTDLNNNQECEVLDEFTLGAHHMIRVLRFADGGHWIARLAMAQEESALADAEDIMQREEDVMRLISHSTNAPVPHVYAYFKKEQTAVNAPVMFMDFCAGNAVMDLSFDHIPYQFKSRFIKNLADIQVQLSTLIFPQIGSIVALTNGSYGIGPLPGVGGPFNTTTEFLKAWYRGYEFRHDHRAILDKGGYFSDLMARRIHHFREQIIDGVFDTCAIKYNDGPFVLKHVDLGQNNIVIDNNYNIVGIVDWEHSFSAPLLLAEMPKMFSICPPGMGIANQGLPPTVEISERVEDRAEYYTAVYNAENNRGVSHMLSEVLNDNRFQEVGAALRMYHDPGHIGWYGSYLPYQHQGQE